jgi:predicted nucleic acid-binding protein
VTLLVDTSVWVDHLRRGDEELARRLLADEVTTHRLVIEELACGPMSPRAEMLDLLEALPRATEAEHAEFLTFVERWGLAASGLGAIDVHLLAAAKLSHVRIWTRDGALARAAKRLGVGLD